MKAIVESQIAGKEISHQPALEFGNDADGFDRLFASPQMDREKREQGRANAMQVMADLVDWHARFIRMEDGFLGQDFHQPLFKGLQRLVQFLAGTLQGGLTDGITEHLLAHFTDPPAGSLLDIIEVGEQSSEILPILDWSIDVGRKGSRAGAVAAGALFNFSPMLGAFQFQGRQIKDLAALKINGGLMGEIFAALTLQQGMNLRVLGSVAELEGAARVARLAA